MPSSNYITIAKYNGTPYSPDILFENILFSTIKSMSLSVNGQLDSRIPK